MSDDPLPTPIPPIGAAICIDAEVFFRYRAILRHLCVGLIDLISSVRLLTTTPQAESLTLGPVQAIVHEELRWPLRKRRFQALVDSLSNRPPTVIHAMSGASYGVAEQLAARFKADLVFQVAALSDCQMLRHFRHNPRRHVICGSKPLLELCTKKYKVPADQATLIHPGVSCAESPTCFQDETHESTILSTASLTSDSGVENLIRAVHLLKTQGHDCLTFLLGTGPDESHLRKLVRDLGIGTQVVFAQPEGDIPKAMIGADIFVQPSVETAISARSLQALGCGMAVAAIDGGVFDAYTDGETAVLCDVASPAALAAGIARLLTDHDFARRLATNALAFMKKNHTMSAMAEQTAEVYVNMARAAAPPPVPQEATS